MGSLFRQCAAVMMLNLRSLPERAAMSLATVLAVAVAVAILLGFLALANGFDSTLKGSGSDRVAVVLRGGAESELNSTVSQEQLQLIEEAPGVARLDGRPLVSGELYLIVGGKKRSSNTDANLPLRGIGPMGLALRDGFKIAEGRMFTPGTNEVIVGRGLLNQFAGFELGNTVRFGADTWKVVGVFEAPGSVFESELLADARVVGGVFNRGTAIQTVRAQLVSPAAMQAFTDFVKNDPRLQLEAKSEKAYFAGQSGGTATLIKYLGWPLGIIMAVGALAGALNTMFSSVSDRATEIATLRIIGFSGFAAFFGTLVESLALSVIGALVGVLGVFLLFNGASASTLSAGFTQVVFQVKMSPDTVLAALIVAIVIGVVGGFFPGIRAARQSPLAALNQ